MKYKAKFWKQYMVGILSVCMLLISSIGATAFAQTVGSEAQAFTEVDLSVNGSKSALYTAVESVYASMFNAGDAATVVALVSGKVVGEDGLTVYNIPDLDREAYDIQSYWTSNNVRILEVKSKEVQDRDRAVLVYHGGASVMGMTWEAQGGLLKALADKGYTVYAVDYHTTLEVKEDGTAYDAKDISGEAERAYEYVLNKYKANSIDLWGDSFGGNLACDVVLYTVEANIGQPANVYLSSPWLDLTGTGESYTTNFTKDVLFSNDFIPYVSDIYSKGYEKTDVLVSPYFGDYTKVRSNFNFVVGTTELLLSDSLNMAKKLITSGKNVNITLFTDVMHDSAATVGQGVYEFDTMFDTLTKTMDKLPRGERQNPYWIDRGSSYWG